jgi:endonuclease-3
MEPRGIQRPISPLPSSSSEPLNGLVLAILSDGVSVEDADRAFERLVEHFKGPRHGWIGVRDARPETVIRLIGDVARAETKGPRIQAVLKEITELRGGELSLGFLRGMPNGEARAWLDRLPGARGSHALRG